MSSAKWRAMQHRHRYTYNAVAFPSAFSRALSVSSIATDPKSSRFAEHLGQLPQHSSTYAQVAHSKSLASSFAVFVSSIDLRNGGDRLLLVSAARLYLELLFLENSLPLHRAILSGLFKVRDKDVQEVICGCFKELFEEYSRFVLETNGETKRFSLSRVALSVMGMPKLNYLVSIVDGCAEIVAWDVVLGLASVVSETEACVRPSPIVLEQCQEGCSCLYYLIQRFPEKFKGDGLRVTKRVLNVLMRVLKSMAFSRDCFVSAGVSFCAALQLVFTMEELGMFIMQGIFRENSCRIRNCDSDRFDFNMLVAKVPFEGELCAEIRSISSLSRLCLIRGILTALSRELLNAQFYISNACSSVKTILFDEILPELCNYGENPVDSHFNFHALTVLQICLQQIKTSLVGKVTDLSGNYCPLTEGMSTRILKLIWNNLEDPLSQTVKQVHLIFDLFLEIISTDSEGIQLFLRQIAMDLLHLGPRCKGRYIPLSLLTKRLGAKSLLKMCPNLLNDTIQAYIDDDVCCAATSFLKCFLENLRNQCWDADGVENGYTNFRNHCLPPFLLGLASGVSKLRSNLNTYALPALLEIDEDIIFSMIDAISVGKTEDEIGIVSVSFDVEQKVAIMLSLLKVSRALALFEGDIDLEENSGMTYNDCLSTLELNSNAFVFMKGIKVTVPVKWLDMALTHVDEFLRVDAAESLFLNPKTSSIPSSLELKLLRKAIPLNMRSSSAGFQMKWTSLFRKFFSRVRTALERQQKLGAWLVETENSERIEEISPKRAQELLSFMKWLSSFLFFSCYPSAPYKRKIIAMELILIILSVWPIVPRCTEHSHSSVYPYTNGASSSNFTLLLVGSIIDSWDRLRENSVRLLLYFPTPLPGISRCEDVVQMILWAKKLVCSPRVRESDAGALTFRLLFRKYVIEMKCLIRVSPVVSCSMSVDENSVVEYMKELVEWLNAVVVEGEKDLSEACNNCFVHGVLLTLRYTFEELDWNSDCLVSRIEDMKHLLQTILDLVKRITSVALWVVSADAWYLPNGEDFDDNDLLMDNSELNTDFEEDAYSVIPLEKRAQEQIVMVGCWLAMKEVSLLLGTIIRKIPLPDLSKMKDASNEVLDAEQLRQIGGHFLEVLLKMKHNGAIDKTRAGFTALCNRLLCSNDSRLCSLPESWMDQLAEKTIAKGQVVDDLLRRSAGIPAAFMALFLSEPDGAPKKLLPRALRWLIDVAARFLNDSLSCNNADVCSEDNLSKVRKEGVIPTVHAFNVLRACFNDTNLSVDTSGFAAEAMILSIRSFSSPHWEIRNSACLAYASLIRRMIGFMNIQKRESARRALTGLEFFHRYPALHPFVFNELKIATDLLTDANCINLESNIAKAVHPSLCPLLILLSRLKPSSIASESGDPLDPYLFLPFIKKCSMQSNMRIRVLASKAVTCLVSNEKLPSVLLNVVSELPLPESKVASSYNSVHGILLQLSCLVDGNCRYLADFAKKEKILGELILLIAKYKWIASPVYCPCPVLNASYLKLLDHMLGALRCGPKGDSFSLIRDLLLALSAESLEMDDSYGLPYYDPTILEARKQATMSLCICLHSLPEENSNFSYEKTPGSHPCSEILERLVRSLTDSSYEVRLAILKWLLHFVKFSENFSRNDVLSREVDVILKWMKLELQSKLMELLEHEKHHKCYYYILKLFFAWKTSQEQLGSVDFDSIHSFWEKLVFMYEHNRHTKTKEQILRCMATCINCYSKQLSAYIVSGCDNSELERAQKSFDCVVFFVDLIKQHSSSSETLSMRRAVVDSVVASGVLEQADSLSNSAISHGFAPSKLSSCFAPENAVYMYGKLVLDLWFIGIKLMEDEDDVVRQQLALNIQKLIPEDGSAERTPSQVEKVIKACFDYLTSAFGKWVFFFEYVSEFVFNEANCSTSTSDLVRQLFDKEIDNHHEEKLFICQLCCFHLEKLPISSSWLTCSSPERDFKHFLGAWRFKFWDQSVDFGRCYAQKEDVVVWIGGMGNHKDVFLPLYCNMLGFYALSSCILGGEVEDGRLMADVVELGKAIAPFLSSSLICCLYMHIVNIHERKLGISCDDSILRLKDDCQWETFDPYFLF